MNLLYEPPELPATAWTTTLSPASEVDIERWIASQLDAAGAVVKQISTQRTETARGWGLDLLSYDADGKILVIAVYQFFDLIAAIAVGGLDLAWLRTHDLEVAAALRAVELDWVNDEPLTIRELWSEPLR